MAAADPEPGPPSGGGPLAPLLAAAAGGGGALGFGHGALAGFGWLAPLAGLTLLFVLLAAAARPRTALLLGLAFGLGYFGVGASWTHSSLHVHGGLPLPAALAAAWAFCAFLALFHGLAAWAGHRLGGPGAGRLLALAAAWTAAEHLRGWLFGGFGWLAFGYAQVPHGPLSGYVPVVGVFGATALTIAAAALLAGGLRAAAGRGPALGAAAALLAGGWGLRAVDHLPAGGEQRTLEASVVQGAVPQDRQWLAANVHELPALYLELFAEARGLLAVAPESALPFQWEDLDPAVRAAYVEQAAFRSLVLGTFTRDGATGRSRNSAALLVPHAAPRFYSKRRLTPYGEFLPFAALLEPVLRRARIPYADLQPGAAGGVFEIAGTRVDLSICYESLFPRLFARDGGVELLATITNDSWFDGTAMPAQHLQIAAGRALERQRFMLRASNTGPSAVIRPDGTLAAVLPPLERGVLAAHVELRRGLTPYMRWGDAPVLVPALMALAWLLLAALRRGTAYMKG